MFFAGAHNNHFGQGAALGRQKIFGTQIGRRSLSAGADAVRAQHHGMRIALAVDFDAAGLISGDVKAALGRVSSISMMFSRKIGCKNKRIRVALSPLNSGRLRLWLRAYTNTYGLRRHNEACQYRYFRVGNSRQGRGGCFADNAAEISRRLGRDVNVFMVSTRNAEKGCRICPPQTLITEDPFEVVQRPKWILWWSFRRHRSAKKLVLTAIEHGKHVVTANKKLLAEYGNEIFALAEQKNVMVQFEAAVAGGIPIIKALREGLAANRSPVDRRHHQWHQQFHSHRNARKRQRFCRCVEAGASWAMQKPTPAFRYRRP